MTLAAIAAAANLPDAHDIIALLRGPDGVDFDNARESIIAKIKAKTLVEGIASGICVQLRVSFSTQRLNIPQTRVGV